MDSDQNTSACECLALLLSRSQIKRRLVALLLEGKTRKVIATELQRSQHTIDSHLKAIYRTIGVGDRARLMMIAQLLIEQEPPPPPEMGTGVTRQDEQLCCTSAKRLRAFQSFFK